MKVLVTQWCLTLCDPTDYSPTGSSRHGMLQTRILEWIAVPFSRGSFWPRDKSQGSCNADGSLPSEPPNLRRNVESKWAFWLSLQHAFLINCVASKDIVNTHCKKFPHTHTTPALTQFPYFLSPDALLTCGSLTYPHMLTEKLISTCYLFQCYFHNFTVETK